ncbi:hypothetical protein ACR9YC_12735 [Parasphingorhabdus sp. DH2-15]|uniref:hypothetical protein n=1 Tax=Parasphingorhabdus sp. DH2-15 TaxID=3444112 RepID=UPI003F685931
MEMTSLAKRVLGSFLAATMLATPVAACAAEESAISETNTATANESTDSAPKRQATELSVQYVGATDLSLNGARFVAANASRDKVAVVVWGGNRIIQQEAYKAALDLIDMGVPVAFVLAPDTNGLEGDAGFQIYAKSEPRFDGVVGTNNAKDLRPLVLQNALDAHKQAFPQHVATLTVR